MARYTQPKKELASASLRKRKKGEKGQSTPNSGREWGGEIAAYLQLLGEKKKKNPPPPPTPAPPPQKKSAATVWCLGGEKKKREAVTYLETPQAWGRKKSKVALAD